MTALFAVLAIDAYQASKDHVIGVMAAVSAAVGLLVAPQSMLLISMVVYILLLVSRFVVAKRRGTLPEHMLVADEAAVADAHCHPGPPHTKAESRATSGYSKDARPPEIPGGRGAVASRMCE